MIAVPAAVSLVIGVVATMGASAAHATPSTNYLYAAPSASGSGSCADAADACSLQGALDAAIPGSIIRLTTAGDIADPASYYVGNWTVATVGTTDATPITIAPAPGVKYPVLDGNGNAGLGLTCSTASCGSSILTIASGVHVNISALTIQNASSADGHGGGIDDAGGVLAVRRTTFANNVAGGFASEGGAISVNGGGTLAVSESTFDSNSAGYFAGAIGIGAEPSGNATATVTTSTFTGNHAGVGYTIGVGDYYGYGELTVTHSTFSANGGSIDRAVNYGGGTVMVAANVFDGGCSIDPSYLTDAGYNIGTDSSCQNGGPGDNAGLPSGSPQSPALGALAANGGPTRTIILRGITPNPAVDAIPASTSVTIGGGSVELCPTTDQRGVTNDGATGCHAGAVQAVQAIPAPPRYVYAASTAIGTADCASAANACSLDSALSAAGPGTTVRLTSTGSAADPSTYYVGNWTIATAGTTQAEPVRLAPAPGVRNTVLDGNSSLNATCSTASCTGAVLTVASGVHVDITGVTIQDAGNVNGHGGAINDSGGDVTVSRTTFAHNSASGFASEGGAVSVNSGGTLAVSASTFDSNSAGYFAGAIGVGAIPSSTGTATVTTSTFSGNSAGAGAAIGVGDYYGYGDLTVTNSTFSGSTGSIDRAAAVGGGGGGTVTVAGNIFDGGCAIDPSYLTDAGYNVGTDMSCQNGGTGDDATLPTGAARSPGLGSPAINGGTTKTMILRPVFPRNPAIDAIPDGTTVTIGAVSVALCPVPDQRGVVGPAGAACDAGALQRVGPPLRPIVAGVSPSSGSTTGGTQVDITGNRFVTGATATIAAGDGSGTGSLALTDVTVVSGTEITATLPSGLVRGSHKVYVTTAGGTSAASKNATYVVVP